MKKKILCGMICLFFASVALSAPSYDPVRVDHTSRYQYPLTYAERILLMNAWNQYSGNRYTLQGVTATNWQG